MNLSLFSDFSNDRIEKITQELLKKNSEFALATEKSKKLYESIEPIINRKNEITISAGDCLDFKELLEHEFTATTIVQQELYKRGYIDCIKLLKSLGVLT